MDKRNDMKFLFTYDEDSANELKSHGYQLLNFSNGKWVFINDVNKPMNFSMTKVAYTNVLTF